MILYSKDNITKAVTAMKNGDRMAHGFFLTGEKGVGKKTAAAYIAKVLMCESCTNGVPCGKCRHCRRIDENIHPDVIRPERSGIKQIYSRDTIREICSDAFTAPNDCDAKVYIFADCESIEERSQDLMLKLIEEPPDTAYFIFTAADRSALISTILSRVITFGVSECSEEECRRALADMGKYTPEQIEKAADAYHGNIGSCIEYLENGAAAENAVLCTRVIDSLIKNSEYELNKALYDIGENREKIKDVLALTDKVIRDVCIIRLNGKENVPLIGCYRIGAERLAERLSFRRAENIHNLLCRTIDYCKANVNVPVAMSALSGQLMG